MGEIEGKENFVHHGLVNTYSKFRRSIDKRQETSHHSFDTGSVTELSARDGPVGSDDCYLSLPSFNDYREICDTRHYRALPSDWIVIVTDIAGSTTYFESGRYRDVNTVGAMPIAAVRNVIGDTFPYVFGGDGASLVVRPEQKDAVINALLAVQRLVAKNYGMHLRVGCVTVSE